MLPSTLILTSETDLGDIPLTSPVVDNPVDRVTFTHRELRRNLTRGELNRWALSNLVRAWHVDDSGFYPHIHQITFSMFCFPFTRPDTGAIAKQQKFKEEDFIQEWKVYVVVSHTAWKTFEKDVRKSIDSLLKSDKTIDDRFSEGVRLRGAHNLPTRVPTNINEAGIITQCDFPFMLEDYSDSEVRLMHVVEKYAKEVYEKSGGLFDI
ncbi:hypothetical protein CC1G_02456 [Coprinopsis cinerea okayama7|uniref:Uncharacterized protein n=1 Tax=Coprinopsis cinerea (strain Okayama-7 / 130 / ATCC MYA-4618 / FGSC 9003) TaxID=240176 RepID=A8NBJ6_COPC7|nr:hypothetical protein CC1G_02456 [Coprinopsis cinerea okayama7\|eukprot:XP_001832194.2 hypothetical protein CC1G_02456 [Coprinopsis cinerea okayama7\